jgi:hypothetical protein
MKTLLTLTTLGACFAAVACGGSVEPHPDAPPAANTDPTPGGAPGTEQGSTSSVSGMPCTALHGTATLANYRTDAYASSAFSFEFASQDPKLTANRFELLYEDDMFLVNMVGGDASFIVDLGAVDLREVPRTVSPDAYPTGEWDRHDAIQAQLGHTYFVRTVHADGRLVSSFRVAGLDPGRRASIEWIRSTDPDVMLPPTACF